ncbi:hypothetical protein HU200_067194 [Digitaria exilis]|uniref:Stigma-specific Stig1 family protein n=1 Tax=Digitaria exilis TaxID=1010633 RepID=A0A834ZYV1_9POAL|nr:hypothetical protein HU200_067194 [Digitaria exilis]CAB3449409.1 unnamed protein product [Digitaria exilis]
MISTTSSLLAVLLIATSAVLVVAASTPARGGASGRGMLASRFLATAAARREIGRGGSTCRPSGHPAAGACSGGVEHRHRFKCCGGACTDVMASASNCGACGRRCPFGRLCCAGRCVAVAYDAGNCGACGRACAAGTPCIYGMCGYA